MVNQQLLNYIKQQVLQGIPSDAIKKSLITSGWQEADINEVFATLSPTQQVVQLPTQSTISEVSQPVVLPKKTWVRRTASSLVKLAVLYLIFIYLPDILNLFTKDIATPEYSDLKLEKVVIDDKDNAYYDIQNAEKTIYYPMNASTTISEMAFFHDTWDEKLAEEIVARNADTFENLKIAASKPKFQYPQFADPKNISHQTKISTSTLRLSELVRIHALYLSRQGKTEEAINEALILVSLGQKMQDSYVNNVSYLVASVLKSQGEITIQRIIQTSFSTNEDLKRYSERNSVYSNYRDGFIKMLKIEHYTSIFDLNGFSVNFPNVNLPSSFLKSNYYFKRNKTEQMFINNTRNQILRIDKPYAEKFSKRERCYNSSFMGILRFYFKENTTSCLFFEYQVILPLDTIKLKAENTPLIATQTIIALKEFKNDNNTLPLSLNELVPNYLLSIPTDPYDGKQIKYSKDKKILYFVGTSTEDVGGSDGSTFDWSRMKNPTFRFDF